jgi:hypothetical protein
MNHRTTLSVLILIAVAFSSSVAMAEEETKAEDWFSFSFDSTWKSKWIAPNGIETTTEPVVHSSLTVGVPHGFYFNIWHSGSADEKFLDSENPWASELDYTVGWSGKLMNWLDVDVNVSYWDSGKMIKKDYGDFLVTSFNLSKTFALTPDQSITPFVNIKAFNRPIDNWTNAGVYALIGARHNIALTEKLDLTSTIMLIQDDGVIGFDNGSLGSAGAKLNYKVTDNISIHFGIDACTPLEHLDDGRRTQVVPSGGISITW